MEPEGSLPYSQCVPPFPILSQLDPVRTPTSRFLKIHINNILPSKSQMDCYNSRFILKYLSLSSRPVVTHGTTSETSSALCFTMHGIAWGEKAAELRLLYKINCIA